MSRAVIPVERIEHSILALRGHKVLLDAALASPRAIEMTVHVVRALVRLREMIGANKELARKLDELERKLATHDQAIAGLIEAIRERMSPPKPAKKRRIGFV